MLKACGWEARGLQMIECPAARALDLQLGEAGRSQLAAAMATAYFKHVHKPSDFGRLPPLAREQRALAGLQVGSANRRPAQVLEHLGRSPSFFFSGAFGSAGLRASRCQSESLAAARYD
jgi:hypothetical protein